MATIQYYDFVSSPRLIGKGKYISEWNPIVARSGIAGKNVAPRRFYVPMSRKVEESGFTVICIIRGMAITENGACRSPKTEHADHLNRAMPNTFS